MFIFQTPKHLIITMFKHDSRNEQWVCLTDVMILVKQVATTLTCFDMSDTVLQVWICC